MNTNHVLRQALASMGYQEKAPGRWLKPIGFQLLSFDESRFEWTNWVINKQGRISIWEKHIFSDREKLVPLHFLKMNEAATRLDVCVDANSRFELDCFEEVL